MRPSDSSAAWKGAQSVDFSTTLWTVVLGAAEGDSAAGADALEKLCQTYWYPLYAYVRRRGNSPHDAQDLTQGFFAHLLGRNFLENVAPQRGKFRSFLLASMNHFLLNERDRANTIKRGRGQTFVPIDAEAAEGHYRHEPADPVTAEHIYEQRWARTVLDQALAKLREEFSRAGKLQQFDRLKEFLQGEVHPGDYEKAAPELHMTSAAIAKAVQRLRNHYGEMVRAEVAQTVQTPADLEDEMRYLLNVLSR